MPFTITQFGSDTSPALPDLDQNFKALGVLSPIPCTASGTNTISLTPQTTGSGSIATSIALTAYQNGVKLDFIAAATNTGATTAAYAALAGLTIYKDGGEGVVALVGGEIIIGCAISLIYDSALSSGGGGWHLVSTSAIAGTTIAPALIRTAGGVQWGATTNPTLTRMLNGNATLAFTSLVPNSAQEQTFTLAGVSLTDRIIWNFPQPNSIGLSGFAGYVIAAGTIHATLGVRVVNVTAASTITPGTVTIGAMAMRAV